MSLFPSLVPSTRLYAPGDLPQSRLQSLSGIDASYRRGNRPIGGGLSLGFSNITESEFLLLRDHYIAVQGTYQEFLLTAETWEGLQQPFVPLYGDFVWRYAAPLAVSHAFCGRVNVEVELEAVPSIEADQFVFNGGLAALTPVPVFIVNGLGAGPTPARETTIYAGGAL